MPSPTNTYRTKPIISGVRLLALLAIGVASAAVQAAPVIYSQPEDGVNALPSGTGVDAVAYDDFTFANGATVTDVHWHGTFDEGSEGSQISDFTIQFWTDNAGQPGAAAEAAQTFAGNANQTNAHSCIGTLTCFDYSVDLTTPFVAAANTRYWLSIVPTLALPTVWAWESGTGPNSISYVDFQGTRVAIDFDLAFDLTGTVDGGAVPEPATLALLGLGLAGLGFSRRRKLG